ncbi:MAG: glycogen synthase GlgA [Proteobacteria bacterium]|nr:glycogen synthase GlgA [Pseudomonadota bacterium]MDE3207879.1 glycogen synthase GlgA [Pseudomonadota bacterium]
MHMEKSDTLAVLFVTSEISPFIKTGGLADVSASLPAALQQLGVDIRVLTPAYPSLLEALPTTHSHDNLFLSSIGTNVGIIKAIHPTLDIPLYLLDYPPYFHRTGGPYQDIRGKDWQDNVWRFGLLGEAAAAIGCFQLPHQFAPAIVHCNDWQTGLAPAYLHFCKKPHASSLMTIHNLAFQGNFPPLILPRLDLPWEAYNLNGLEFFGHVSFMKAGLQYSDAITTVSPTYAQEIQTEELGFGFNGLLHERREALTGILNGIHETEWDPARDPFLEHHYSRDNLANKSKCKQALKKKLGLDSQNSPLIGVVSRMTYQKGLDLFIEIAPLLISSGAQLAILGNGEAPLENQFRDLASRFPGKIALRIGFDEALAHQITAGADLFVMPSRYEPCGLNQMYSQHYGTPPIVHATGGLADTVADFRKNPSKATGFMFHEPTSQALLTSVKLALNCYQQQASWHKIIKQGMKQDFSWKRNAQQYIEVYNRINVSR